MNSLISLDQSWLLAINSWQAPWADELMWLISGKWTWLPLYLLLAAWLWWKTGWKNTLIILIGFGIAVGLSDYVSSGIIKHWVCRLRPTHDPLLMDRIHIVHHYRGGLYGFVSSHAANTVCVATLFTLIGKKIGTLSKWIPWLLFLWVGMNSYSRMYLGVHYPLDILGGLMVGIVSAVAVYRLLLYVLRVLDKPEKADTPPSSTPPATH